ncbi:hypothetical protein BV898_12854 [Hypsibius exemplaris]|uniref:Gustatory receptor n=1 Tax=Hypsibius exemplaris TaxID=2072580 RepID=A0A1W0WCQ6_HYPEX|nr:hypothetical protein BV898_12854 [Hypsibius exemplaris]
MQQPSTPSSHGAGHHPTILTTTYSVFHIIMRTFGTYPNYNKRTRPLAYLTLLTVLLIFLLFLAQLTFMFLQAIVHQPIITVLEIHVISHSSFVLATILGMVIFTLRSKRLQCITSAIAQPDSSLDKTDQFLLKLCCHFTGSFLFHILGQFATVLTVKVTAIYSLSDSFFGLQVPAALLSSGMIIILTLAIAIRATHLGITALSCGILGIRFRRLTLSLKHHRDGKFTQSLDDHLKQHYYLSHLVHELDEVLAPSSLIFLASDIVVVTTLISYFISESVIEAPLGLFVTQGLPDRVTYIMYGIGAVGMLVTRVTASAFLNDQAQSIVPELYEILHMQGSQDSNLRMEKSVNVTLQRLRDIPVGLTGWDLFVLNKNFILTVLGLLATYLVVVVDISSKNECSLEYINVLSHPRANTTVGF